jgi:hypothetical protein
MTLRHSQYARFEENIVSLEPRGIAAAVQAFMVLPDDDGDRPLEFDILQNFITDFGMVFYQFEFDSAQATWFGQYLCWYVQLSYIVEYRTGPDSFHPLHRNPTDFARNSLVRWPLLRL